MSARALRAHALAVAGDAVLRWVSLAAFAMSLSLATSIPAELMDAPDEVRQSLTAPFSTVLAAYGAVLAAVYGSFRYTVDRRDGVIAQRLMLQTRRATLATRLPATALGGAAVALAATLGGHAALVISMGGVPPDGRAVAAASALGAVAGLWGVGLGLVVQSHLVALFLSALSIGSSILVAIFWKVVAVYLPLLALLEAFRFDVSAVGIMSGERLDSSVATLVSVGWVLTVLVAGSIAFMRRDVK